MPAEWTPHVATWMAWPCDDELWVGELEPVRREFAELVRAVASFEPVELLVRDAAAEADAAARLAGANVRLHRVAYDDVWLRDSGPIFVAREGRLRLVELGVQRLGRQVRRRDRQRGASARCAHPRHHRPSTRAW